MIVLRLDRVQLGVPRGLDSRRLLAWIHVARALRLAVVANG